MSFQYWYVENNTYTSLRFVEIIEIIEIVDTEKIVKYIILYYILYYILYIVIYIVIYNIKNEYKEVDTF